MLLVFFGPNGSFTQLKYGVAGEVLGKGGGGGREGCGHDFMSPCTHE